MAKRHVTRKVKITFRKLYITCCDRSAPTVVFRIAAERSVDPKRHPPSANASAWRSTLGSPAPGT